MTLYKLRISHRSLEKLCRFCCRRQQENMQKEITKCHANVEKLPVNRFSLNLHVGKYAGVIVCANLNVKQLDLKYTRVIFSGGSL